MFTFFRPPAPASQGRPNERGFRLRPMAPAVGGTANGCGVDSFAMEDFHAPRRRERAGFSAPDCCQRMISMKGKRCRASRAVAVAAAGLPLETDLFPATRPTRTSRSGDSLKEPKSCRPGLTRFWPSITCQWRRQNVHDGGVKVYRSGFEKRAVRALVV